MHLISRCILLYLNICRFFNSFCSCFLCLHSFSPQFLHDIKSFVDAENLSGCLCNVSSHLISSANDKNSRLYVYQCGINTNGVNIMAKSQL